MARPEPRGRADRTEPPDRRPIERALLPAPSSVGRIPMRRGRAGPSPRLRRAARRLVQAAVPLPALPRPLRLPAPLPLFPQPVVPRVPALLCAWAVPPPALPRPLRLPAPLALFPQPVVPRVPAPPCAWAALLIPVLLLFLLLLLLLWAAPCLRARRPPWQEL